MLPTDKTTIISQTKKWVTDVVVGCNFCPFAAREVKRGSILYEIIEDATLETSLQALAVAFDQLNINPEIETCLLIIPNGFENFSEYLNLIELADALLEKENYEGIYQVASFHPQYLFAGSNSIDPSNYTNRSPYPMLHLLREESISSVIDSHPNIDEVPERNIAFTQEKGIRYMKELLAACMINAG